MKDKFLKILLLAYLYMLSADMRSYANISSETEDCRLVPGMAEYSCAAVMLLVLATCAARRLRNSKGHQHVKMDEAGKKMKASHKTADNRKNLSTHPSSKKETPVVENISKSSGRSKVDQQQRRQLEVMDNLDRLISLMPRDESDSEFLLTKPRCQVHSQDQSFYSWSTSSTDSSVSVEETKSRKSAEHSPKKGARDALATPEKQDIISGDDYSGAIIKRKSDGRKHAVPDMSSQMVCDEVDFGALHNVVCGSHRKTPRNSPQKGARDALATPEKQDIIIKGDDYSGATKKRKSDDRKHAVEDMSSQMVCDEVDFSALHNEVCGSHIKTTHKSPKTGARDALATAEKQDIIIKGDDYSGAIKKRKSDDRKHAGADMSSHRKTTRDTTAHTGISTQKVSVEVQVERPEGSRDPNSDTVQVSGDVGFERARKSLQASGSETEGVDNEPEWSCFLHNVARHPKRKQAKTSSISNPKSDRSRFSQLEEEAMNKVTPVTVYSKKNTLPVSSKSGRREPERGRSELSKTASSRNVLYMLSSPADGALVPHAQHYEELKNEIPPTTTDSTNEEASFISHENLTKEMTQRTQKFSEESVPDPTQWDLLYSFPRPLRCSETAVANETDGCKCKTSSYDDTGTCTTGSNSSFERVVDFLRNLKPFDTNSNAVERSPINTSCQLGSIEKELQSVQLLPASTTNDVNEDSRSHIPGNQYNKFSNYIDTTSEWNDYCSNAQMGLPDRQQMDIQKSPVLQRRDKHQTTAACQTSSSNVLETTQRNISDNQ